MENYKALQADYLKLIEGSLAELLPAMNTSEKQVIEAMRYSLLGGGKRIRGILVLAFYQLFGGENLAAALPFASGVEMIHAYSLIHDDLPCMDNDDLRRGRPSCHIAYGESTALLAGDGLLTLAFQSLSRPENLESFTAAQIVEAVHTLAVASGATGMIGGQVLDLANESRLATKEEVTEAEVKKTGALITAAASIGGIIGGANRQDQNNITAFGQNIGLAFQIMDDVLDATSTREALGKPIGSDKHNEKSTFTSLYGVDKAKKLASEHTETGINNIRALGRESKFLEHLANQLADRSY